MVSVEDFAKLELKVGIVLEVEEVERSDKLIKLKVDLGEEEPRTIFVGIKAWYQPQDLKGQQLVVIANLEPKRMMNEYSQGMILAADAPQAPVFLTVPAKVPPGTKIR